jgi:Subtilisin-like serine proteases
MAIYIIRPKISVVQGLSLAARTLSIQDRNAQVNEVRNLRLTDPVDKEIKTHLRSIQGVKFLSKGETSTPITGTTVADIPDEADVEQIKEDMPDALFIRDCPIGLIDPGRAAATRKNRLAAKDLWHLESIGLTAARKNKFKGMGNGVTVAVLDTGIDATHPELMGRIAEAYTLSADAWAANPMNPSSDTQGHGTHVAGLICGKKAGVAPGATLLNGVMLPKGRAKLSDLVFALEWAGSRPDVQIINMSAGIRGYLDDMHEVIADLLLVGVLPIIAVGNEGEDTTRSPGNYKEVLSVGAMDRDKKVAAFSGGADMTANNHRYTVPHVVAPGKGVFSSIMGDSYEDWNGTSMATPIVSGVAALIVERYPTITVLELREAILEACQDLGLPEKRQGKGLVQVRPAL